MQSALGIEARIVAQVLWLVALATVVGHATAGPGCPCGRQGPLAVPSTCLISHDEHSIRALRIRIDRNPTDLEARDRLVEVDSDRPLPKESASYHSARELLPAHFVELQTRRFIVISDASPEWTRAQAERLERAHHQFMRFCSRLELEPLPLEHKLVCILFERRDDYRRFAELHDDVRDEWVAGYYSPRHDRIVFYNVESDPQVERARSMLHQMEYEIDELDRRVARLASTGLSRQAWRWRHTLARYEEHLAQERGRVEAFTRQVSIATTIHEAIHQLAFHTRIQSPYVQNPLWISEGLATAFETDTPLQAFGPEHEYPLRRNEFTNLLAKGNVLPLAELIPLTNLTGADERKVRTFYHQSYALVTWMSRFRRVELRRYLNLLAREEPGAISRERHVELFTKAFGDLTALERTWLRHERAQLAAAGGQETPGVDSVTRPAFEVQSPPAFRAAESTE